METAMGPDWTACIIEVTPAASLPKVPTLAPTKELANLQVLGYQVPIQLFNVVISI